MKELFDSFKFFFNEKMLSWVIVFLLMFFIPNILVFPMLTAKNTFLNITGAAIGLIIFFGCVNFMYNKLNSKL